VTCEKKEKRKARIRLAEKKKETEVVQVLENGKDELAASREKGANAPEVG